MTYPPHVNKKPMTILNALTTACNELGVQYAVMESQEATNYIQSVIKKYNITKTSGHVTLPSEDSISIPFEEFELIYSEYMKNEPACLFFDQESDDRKNVFIINDARRICEVMGNTFGIEYFVSNREQDYVIAVNWY